MTPTLPATLGRRTLLRTAAGALAAGSALLARPSAASAAGATTPSSGAGAPTSTRSTASTQSTASTASTASPVPADPLHLLRRTTYGLTPALVADVQTRGVDAWLDEQLDPARIDDSTCDAAVTRFPLAHATGPQLHATVRSGSWVPMVELQMMTLARAAWSERQLFEVMVEFWSNHLNVTCPKGAVWATRGTYDREVVRAHALGRFSDMLVASSRSAAMMLYLDNQTSRGTTPNENYGREVLELHTVGRDAGYGEAGVVAAARAFSGMASWTTFTGGAAADLGTFRYRSDWHATGPLQVLGWSHANATRTDGLAVAESLMRYLASHPATAARLARKLAVRFVSDDPPQALVDRLAQVYLAGDTAIAPVLRALFASPEFAVSAGQKYTRPYEGTVGVLRALGLRPSTDGLTGSFRNLIGQLGSLGQAPMAWHPPDGYPDVAPAWAGSGTVLGRWNLNVALAKGGFGTGIVNPGPSLYARLLPGAAPASRAELVQALAARLLPGRPLPLAHRDALVAFLGGAGPVRTADTTTLFPVLTALLLDSPAWSMR